MGILSSFDQKIILLLMFISEYKCNLTFKSLFSIPNNFSHFIKNLSIVGFVFVRVTIESCDFVPSPQYKNKPAINKSLFENELISLDILL
jgi:hypothetical protein